MYRRCIDVPQRAVDVFYDSLHRPGASPLKAGAPRAPGRKKAAVIARTTT